jgi:predicted MFS family arabinose efflux permease
LTASAWSPFRHRAFSVLWGAALVSNIGSWMHELAAGWLMTTLAPSPTMVALVQTATTLPVFLLALPAGTLADRVDKRRLQILVQSAMLVLAALLGVLVYRGAVTSSMLLACTLGMGACTAILSPSWQSILPKLVPRDDLQNAVALHVVGMNVARAIGPAVGGALIVALGLAWPFFFNAASFVAVILALCWWRPAAEQPRAHAPAGFVTAMLQGLEQARSNRALQNTLVRSVAFYVFASAYWALLPLVARVQLAGGAELFGVLVGCIGIGAVSGALLLPRLRARAGLDGVVRVGTLGTALAVSGYALLHLPALGMLASLLAGASWLASFSSLNVAAQLAVPDALRARGMALYSSVFYGCLAFGSLIWGVVASHLGLAVALLVAAAGLLASLALARRRPLTQRQ